MVASQADIFQFTACMPLAAPSLAANAEVAHPKPTLQHESLECSIQLLVGVDVPQTTPMLEAGLLFTHCHPHVVCLLVSSVSAPRTHSS
jgi:hypothetical protein